MHAPRNTPNIVLDGTRLQIYPDISPATLDRRRRMKEVTNILQTARIRYRWVFPFKLTVPHNGSTYTAYNVIEGKKLLVKLGLLDPNPPNRPLHPLYAIKQTKGDGVVRFKIRLLDRRLCSLLWKQQLDILFRSLMICCCTLLDHYWFSSGEL